MYNSGGEDFSRMEWGEHFVLYDGTCIFCDLSSDQCPEKCSMENVWEVEDIRRFFLNEDRSQN